MKDVCISTGWYSDGTPTNSHTAPELYKADWLNEWRELNGLHGENVAFSVYASKCAVAPVVNWANVHQAVLPTDYFFRRHDWASSLITGALYAYNNNLDLLYIEQDCLVKNVDYVLDWARSERANIVYGYGVYSFKPGWSEQCLIYIAREYLSHFIVQFIGMKLDRQTFDFPEVIFHRLYKDDADFWPFGYGRKPVDDWSGECFYKQQITPEELNRFRAKCKL
jgi:hypothetical protein